MSQPDPPIVLHVAAFVVVIAIVVLLLRRSPRPTSAALIVLGSQLALTYAALLFGRGLQLGASAGLMTRYLTDTLPVTALAIGLATLPLRGGLSAAGIPPGWPVRPRAVSIGVGVFAVGAIISTITYASNWHANYPAQSFVKTAAAQLSQDPVPLADVEVPPRVQSPLAFPENLPSRLLRPLGEAAVATSSGTDLSMLDKFGEPHPAFVNPFASSGPGPERGCGFRVSRDEPVTLEFKRSDVRIFWWISVGYLSSGDGTIRISIDGREPVVTQVYTGLHTYLLQGEEQFAEVTIEVLEDDVSVCVDRADVGEIGVLG